MRLIAQSTTTQQVAGSTPAIPTRGTIFFQVTQPRKRLTWTLQGLGRRRSYSR